MSSLCRCSCARCGLRAPRSRFQLTARAAAPRAFGARAGRRGAAPGGDRRDVCSVPASRRKGWYNSYIAFRSLVCVFERIRGSCNMSSALLRVPIRRYKAQRAERVPSGSARCTALRASPSVRFADALVGALPPPGPGGGAPLKTTTSTNHERLSVRNNRASTRLSATVRACPCLKARTPHEVLAMRAHYVVPALEVPVGPQERGVDSSVQLSSRAHRCRLFKLRKSPINTFSRD